MLYFALVLSFIMLLVANLIVFLGSKRGATRRSGRLIVVVAFVVPSIALVSMALMMYLPPVWLQALALVAVAVVVEWRRWRPAAFLALSVLATLLIYGGYSWCVLGRLEQLRADYPFVAMDYVPPPRHADEPHGLSTEAAANLRDIELEFERHPSRSREWHLRQLHEDHVQAFVDSEGFGVGRMTFSRSLPSRAILQPGALDDSSWDPAPGRPENLRLHLDSLTDFANPKRFGYVKDRRHVAGFEPHQFGQVPDGRLRTLELVGLVMHHKPVVYISEHLPRMEELRGAPTRALDDFENAGLAKLRHGDDLFVGKTSSGYRMLGAIRNARQCITCHRGDRGDLLGAFAYSW